MLKVPSIRLIDLYLKGVFKSPKQKAEIKAMSREIISEIEPYISQYFIKAKNFDTRFVLNIAKIAGVYDRVHKMMSRLLSNEYNRLQGEVRNINKIKDSDEKIKAIKSYTEEMKHLMQKMGNLRAE